MINPITPDLTFIQWSALQTAMTLKAAQAQTEELRKFYQKLADKIERAMFESGDHGPH